MTKRMDASRRRFLAGATAAGTLAGAGRAAAAPAVRRDGFDLHVADGRITRLRRAGDALVTDYLEPNGRLGGVALSVRRPDGGWRAVEDADLEDARATRPGAGRWGRAGVVRLDGGDALRVTTEFALVDGDLRWSATLENLTDQPLEVGDVAWPLPMNGRFTDKAPVTSFVLKHSFVSGAGSFAYWMRSNSVGPFLLMVPEPGTAFEYWDHRRDRAYRAYSRSAAVRAEVAAHGGSWRLPASALVLGPRGAADAQRTEAVHFAWVDDHAGVRDQLARRGLLDVEVLPGMTVPTGWEVLLAFRSDRPVTALAAEHPGDTEIAPLERRDGRQFARMRFRRLGENRLAVTQAGGGTTFLEFFATEPIETLVAKRGAFIARHQHRDPAKWYHGLLAEWNARSGVMLGPDNYDLIKDWRIYEVTCDDPGLSKPAFLASKNAEHPVQAEVDALDLYIDHFVWGGLQRTTAERYPYGIYGILDWKRNRDSADPGSKGKLHLWRPYDYPHIVCLYLGMWRIARFHPEVRTGLSADAYLARAAGTAIAMFTVPDAVVGWAAYETGFYNECVIPDLIEALAEHGRSREADLLRTHWERKVAFFVRGRPNLFGSEYAFDSTGFESTGAIAAYARDHAGGNMGAGGGGGLRVTPEEARRFDEAQVAANIFCRGSIEPAYYLLGSDYRARGGDAYTLSYMAQMGGGAVLDHGLARRNGAAPYLRLGFQSFLSSWALVNSGTPASGHGYWFPGAANDGAAGGGFEPAAYGETWLDQPHGRGSWYYSCEIDLGFCGALRAARTLLVDDPVFGRVCLGGRLEAGPDGRLRAIPEDGVRRRFHARLAGRTLDMVLDGDRFAAGRPIELAADELGFTVESGDARPHRARMHVSGPAVGAYHLRRGDGLSSVVELAPGRTAIDLAIGDRADQRSFTLSR